MISVLAHLGYGLLRASVTYPFRAGRGKDRFLRSYGPDGLIPASSAQRRLAPSFEGCLGCGLCELVCPGCPELHELARSLWRSPAAWPAMGPILEQLKQADLGRAAAMCPGQVPLDALVTLLQPVVDSQPGSLAQGE